jgi:transcriptional regulator with XRE-family HTH domain
MSYWNSFADMSTLRERRRELGLSQQALADIVGTSQPQIKRLEDGERKLTKEWAERLAPALQTSAETLMFGVGGAKGMSVLGIIEAGQFRDISLLDQTVDHPVIAVARDERFPRADQYALLVAGDSMDQLFPDGSYVTCVNWADTGMGLRPGLIVHVERTIGSLVETTVKEVQGTGPFTLIPRSSNAKHKPIAMDGGPEEAEVTVRGLVTGKWEPLIF